MQDILHFIKKLSSLLRGELLTSRSKAILSNLISNEIDVGFCFGDLRHPSLESIPIFQKKLHIVTHRDSELAKIKKLTTLKQLLAQKPAAFPKGLLGLGETGTHPFLTEHNIIPNIQTLYDNYQVGIDFVKATGGWSFIPDWVIQDDNNQLQPLFPKRLFLPLEITLVYSKNRRSTNAIYALLEMIKKSYAGAIP